MSKPLRKDNSPKIERKIIGEDEQIRRTKFNTSINISKNKQTTPLTEFQ